MALPWKTGGSAIGLSATGACAIRVPVMMDNDWFRGNVPAIVGTSFALRLFFLCAMRRLDPDQMEDYAEECRRRAAAATDRSLKNIFDELARGWKELAALRRRIIAERNSRRLPRE